MNRTVPHNKNHLAQNVSGFEAEKLPRVCRIHRLMFILLWTVVICLDLISPTQLN